jgi:hypothetical protein
MPTRVLRSILIGAALTWSLAAVADPAPPRVQDGPAGYAVSCALNDQPGLHSCADLPAATACAREFDYASRPSQESTGMTFVNRSEQALQVFWLDFQGYRKFYRQLSPGDRFRQDTFIGHNWLVATMDGRCVGIFKATPESLAFF